MSDATTDKPRSIFLVVLLALWNAIKPTLQSKKFQQAMAAVLVQLGAHYGLGLSSDAALALVSPIMASIVGQGIADTKKPCPDCAKPPANDNTAPPTPAEAAPPAAAA